MLKVLFICTGNICRSPTGEGIFRDRVKAAGLADKIAVDSCGMMGWHEGKAPDQRSQIAAANRGVDISTLRGRKISLNDFHDFDLLLVMEQSHFDVCLAMAPVGCEHKIHLFMEPIAGDFGTLEVPDPYYGGGYGFELVADMMYAGSNYWIKSVACK